MSTEAEQQAAMTAWLAENSRDWHNKPYDVVAEERMAHVANGGTLRAVPVAHAMERFPRPDTSRDEQGYEHHGFGNYIWTGHAE